MDQSEIAQEPVEQPKGFNPNLTWAQPATSFNIGAVKPHTCMQNVVQRGRYIHCFEGNHGMRLQPGEMLVGIDKNGQIIDSRSKTKAISFDIIKRTVLPPQKIAKAKKK